MSDPVGSQDARPEQSPEEIRANIDYAPVAVPDPAETIRRALEALREKEIREDEMYDVAYFALKALDALLVERQQVAALLARAEVGWADAVAERQQLIGGIEDYLLWEPGRAGHAEAHRKLAALVAVDKEEK